MASFSGGTNASSVKSSIPMHNRYDRVIVLIDMDCFYCQVEEKLDPELRGKPLAVVQYNAWRGGGIIAVNYAARAMGVTRHMRGDEAKTQCPEIVLAKVPSVREKADLTKYREAGKEVANVLQRFTPLLERASVDEAYLDITDVVNKRLEELNAGAFKLQPENLVNTFAVGFPNLGQYVTELMTSYTQKDFDDESYSHANDTEDLPAARTSNLRLLIGASVVAEIRAAVKSETSYECSAGLAHNKLLAKLACGINKPNKQTILPLTQIPALFEKLPVGKITGLGGKFGEEVCERFGVSFLGQLLQFTEIQLQKKLDEKSGTWLYHLCRGIDLEAVTPRFYSKSIGCCKKFPGRNNITGLNTLLHWLNELTQEILDRLEKDTIENNRRARKMVVSFIQDIDGKEISSSRSASLANYEQETVSRSCLDLIKANTKQFYRAGSDMVLNNAISFLGISVGKFETVTAAQSKLQEMFANQATKNHQNIRNVESDKAAMAAPVPSTHVPNGAVHEINEKVVNDGSVKSFFLQKQAEKEQREISKNNDKNNPEKTINEPTEHNSMSNSFFFNALMKQKETARLAMVEQIRLSTTARRKSSLERSDYSATNINEIARPSSPMNQQQNEEVAPAVINNNYATKYAEFAMPKFQPELLEFVQCDICQAKIPSDERALQTHRDQHYAQQLSQQQRVEYREQLKAKISPPSSKPPSVKAKKRSATRKETQKGNIKKFLVTPASNNSLGPSDDIEVCSICSKAIARSAVQEHADYHVAKDLSKTLNTTISAESTTHPRITNSAKSIAHYFS